MSEQGDQRLTPQAKLASFALSEIQKAIRFFRLYPPSHPFCVKGVAEAIIRLRRYHDKFDDLTADIMRDGVYVGECNAVPESGQSTDLCTLLYPAGIFSLTIRRGVSEREISDFIDILSDSYIQSGSEADAIVATASDMLSALWQREFSLIHMAIQDQLSPGSKKLDPEIAQLSERIHELMRIMRGEDANVGEEYEDRAGDAMAEEFLHALTEATPAVPRADPEQAHDFQRTGPGLARLELLSELNDPTREAPAERAARIVTWADDLGMTKKVPAEILARFRATAALNALANHDLEGATEMVSQLVGSEATLGPELSERLGTVKCLHDVAAALRRDDPRMDPDALIRHGLSYLGRLDGSAAPSAVEVYPTLMNANVRRVFRRYLSSVVGEQAAAIEPLTLHEDEAIVKEAMGILAMAGKDSQAYELLRAYADEDDTLRGAFAKKAVGRISGSLDSEKLHAVVLDDPNRDRRVRAARRLGDMGHAKSYEPLATLIRSKALMQRDDEEILAMFKALRTCGGSRASAVFAELAELKKGLFGGKAKERIGILARMWVKSEQNKQRSKRKKGPKQ